MRRGAAVVVVELVGERRPQALDDVLAAAPVAPVAPGARRNPRLARCSDPRLGRRSVRPAADGRLSNAEWCRSRLI